MVSDYSEDVLVEKEAVKFLNEKYKYSHLDCFEEFKTGKSFLGRENASEVILVSKLKEALELLNPKLPEDALENAIIELKKDRSKMSLVNANKEAYHLIKNGVKVKAKIDDKIKDVIVKVIDFEDISKNDFFMATQFWITGEIYKKRPDLILFVNGLPLVLMEFKSTQVNLKKAYDDNITDYKDTIPQIFWYNSFILISNGLDSKIGTLTSEYEHFSNWKKLKEDEKNPSTFLDRALEGTCAPEKILDLFENFSLFTSINNNQIKIIAKNHQYLGVNNSVESFKKRKENKGRLGVFWHTQGSGKSFSMIFFAQKILRKFQGNYTFVVITDRDELDTQIYKNFQNSGVVTEEEVQAKDGKHLKELLKENHRMVFTLIHKFHTKKGEAYPEISQRDDIIVMTDEAHRTQYDTLALNMRNALPKASFIGFTGTPLMKKSEEKTRDTFGGYVSEYNFKDSVDDRATVPLYYENRVPELQLINPNLNEEIYEVIDEADLNDKEQEKIARKLGSNYDILTREDRLNTIAEDIAKHFLSRGYSGKAMVLAIDKFTTVKMFDKVKYHFNKILEKLKDDLRNSSPEEQKLIKEKISEIKNLDMAVVISSEQNEIKKFSDKGLNIKPHRERMVKEDLAEKFKKPNDPFKLVFVCNMWTTGFDAPSVSTIYLDKPMKNHTLMQAIARANRVFGDKVGGFIVDYISVFKNLKKALAIYASSRDGSSKLPIEAKDQLFLSLKEYIKELNKFLKLNKVDLEKIDLAKGMEKYPLLLDARSKLVVNEKVKKEFLTRAGNTIKIYKAILPHKEASEFTKEIEILRVLIKEIYSLDPDLDIASVVKDIQEVLDLSISSKGYVIREQEKKVTIDISKIDFKKLSEKFEKNKDYAQIERLKNILSFRLREMIQLNDTRIDYQERFESIIKDYNSGAKNAEKYLEALIKFNKELNEEEKRHIIVGLTEEELAIYDKLKKPNLSDKELKDLKKISKELLRKLIPTKIVLDWKKKRQAIASVKITIQDELEKLNKIYTPEEFKQKCLMLFQHLYDHYSGDRDNIYVIQNMNY
jgi:type I restriction enzyme, R subunit